MLGITHSRFGYAYKLMLTRPAGHGIIFVHDRYFAVAARFIDERFSKNHYKTTNIIYTHTSEADDNPSSAFICYHLRAVAYRSAHQPAHPVQV